jgi:hypothetical protein
MRTQFLEPGIVLDLRLCVDSLLVDEERFDLGSSRSLLHPRQTNHFCDAHLTKDADHWRQLSG